ncbi:hypothetical protein Tco_0909781 [Tanacetum coccineum]|uniref:Uncharacterized protein n=1 Tax=Tanacetum coccineum TaxID=301880 RepID=A0ABQ5CUE3_9ASTR
MSVDEELAKKVFEEEQARFNAEQEARFKAEQEQERIDFETALELQKQLDEREDKKLQLKLIKLMILIKSDHSNLKNQGGYKMSHFKGMSYEDIRHIFERVWDQNQAFIPMGSDIKKEVMKRAGFDLQQIIFQNQLKKTQFSKMMQDVLELYRLVKERFQTASPEGYDLLLWGDLKTMIELNEEDEI